MVQRDGSDLILHQVVDIPAGGAVMESGKKMNFLPGFNLVGFPNRNSIPYGEEYGIQKADTIIRGTLRLH